MKTMTRARPALHCSAAVSWTLLTLSTAAAGAEQEKQNEDLANLDLETLMNMDVIVTAQKRSQSVQDVAISMEAYTARQIEELGMNNVADIAQNTPNLHFTSFFEAGKPDIAIRGISIGQLFTNFEQAPVGIYYDEVFIGSRSGQLAQLFDQERVEVLRGPQSTLYGRNTTAGAINFIANKPSDRFETEGSVSYGRFNEFDVDGAVNLPLSDTLALRVSGTKRQRDGWQTNINPAAPAGQRKLDDIDNWGARALLQWKPDAEVTWLLNVHVSGNNTNTPPLHHDLGSSGHNAANLYTGYLASGRWDEVEANDPYKEILKARGAALTATVGFGAITLTSISAYEKTDYTESEDPDGLPYQIAVNNIRDVMSQYSQELRLTAKQGRFDWVMGLFYYHDDLWQRSRSASFTDPFFDTPAFASENITALISENSPTQTSYNYAGFGDVRFAMTDRLMLDVGARYTHEAKHYHGVAFQSLPFLNPGTFQTIGGPADPLATRNPSWSAPTWRAALEWKPAQDILSYGSFSRGFKSGGINGQAANSSAELEPYNPEKIDAYELGLKTAWLGGRLTANAAMFYNHIKGIQTLLVDFSGPVPLLVIRNGARGNSKGAEFELRARPTNRWNVSLGLGVLNTRFDRFILPDGTDYSGHEFTHAPKVTGNALAQYLAPFFGGTLAPRVSVAYTSHRWFDSPENPGIDEQGGYALLDASLPWRTQDERLEVSLWGRNLTDRHYFLDTIGVGLPLFGSAVSYHAAPRTYGVTARYSFK